MKHLIYQKHGRGKFMGTTIYNETDAILEKFRKSENEAKKTLKNKDDSIRKLYEAFKKVETIEDGPLKLIFEDINLTLSNPKNMENKLPFCTQYQNLK